MIPSPLVLTIFGLLIISAAFVLGGLSLAPWVPLRKRDIKRVLRLANLKPGQVFYELGCGDGRLIRSIPDNITAIGLEINPLLYLYSKLRSRNKIIKLKNLYKEDLSTADVIFVFGMPEKIAKKLKAKLIKELKPGTKIISYAFEFKDWQPVTQDKPNKKEVSIYLYKI